MEEDNLIVTASGIRGIYEEDLTLKIAEKIAMAFGIWLNEKEVIIGRDTRPSGEPLKEVMIKGLLKVGCDVTDLEISPTPVIIYAKNFHKIEGGIIISGSHNPPHWNGIKLLSEKTFLSSSELEEIFQILNSKEIQQSEYIDKKKKGSINKINGIFEYKLGLFDQFNISSIKKKNNLRVALDTGAGAGRYLTPKILESLGCQLTLINNDFTQKGKYPREIEPIEPNLQDLIITVQEQDLDVGFAHDCDADRLAIIGNDGTCYPQDIGLALITEYNLRQFKREGKKAIFVTNLASSLRFEALAHKYDAKVIRTPVGERYLAEKMDKLMDEASKNIIFGGEGSCGGVMIPKFNNARDGIYAAAQIVEILVETGKKISFLVQKLPQYHSFRKNVNMGKINIEKLTSDIHNRLKTDYENIRRVKNDLRFGEGEKWFVLIHPSNTEPIIRVISEAKNKKEAKERCKDTEKIVSNLVNKI
ncbi:MAG: hypothetical protein R6U96_18050 [Promethearchaeia archaeon]